MKTNINEMENEYRANAENYKNAINAWSNVKRTTKKDGSDFANFGKNFVNATIRQKYSWCNPTLEVGYRCGNGYYTYDTIEIEKDDTVNDIFVKINNRIKVFNGYIAEAEKKAKNAEYVFSEVDRTVKELIKFCNENGFSSYEVCSFINNNRWSWS